MCVCEGDGDEGRKTLKTRKSASGKTGTTLERKGYLLPQQHDVDFKGVIINHGLMTVCFE